EHEPLLSSTATQQQQIKKQRRFIDRDMQSTITTTTTTQADRHLKPVKSILKPADIQPAETLAERPSPDSEKENYPATTSITKTSTAKERQLITRKARIQPKVKQAITPYQPPAAAHKEAEAEIASA